VKTAADEIDHRAAHLGTVAASLSHDLGNVLATVQQAGGLIEDCLADAAAGVALDADELEPVVRRIERSITRGLEMTRLLNWLAHSVDDAQREADLAAAVEMGVRSARYFARQREVAIELPAALATMALPVRAIDLHRAIFRCCLSAAAATPPGESVTVCPETGVAGPVVVFELSAVAQEPVPPEDLGCRVAWNGAERRLRFDPNEANE
jgi:hypothetical protein